MNELNWLYRRSPLFRSICLVLVVVAMIAVSCQAPNPFHAMMLTDLDGVAEEKPPEGPGAMAVEDLAKITLLGQGEENFAHLYLPSCKENSDSYLWQLRLSTLSLTFPVAVALPKGDPEFGVKVAFGPNSISLAETEVSALEAEEKLIELSQNLCKSGAASAAFADVLPLITKYVVKAYPDCGEGATFSGNTLSCKTPKFDLAKLTRELHDTKGNIIKRWKRQPYILARRLTLSEQLATALKDEGGERLSTFCSVVKSSLPLEVPLVLHSPLWRNAVCAENSKSNEASTLASRKEMALQGLSIAVAELDYFMRLGDAATSSGSLQVRLPFEKEDQKMLWVKLIAADNVSDQLLEKGARLAFPDSETTKQSGYWHPLFGHDGEYLALANFMGLCHGYHEPENFLADAKRRETIGRFLASSITGETSFSLSNGRVKTLRLPLGVYNYELYYYQHLDRWWQPNSEEIQAKGSLQWSQHSPRLSIRDH